MYNARSIQNEAAQEVQKKQEKEAAVLKGLDLSQYAIQGSEDEWKSALKGGAKNIISVKGWVIRFHFKVSYM